jgi:hypothetical protein
MPSNPNLQACWTTVAPSSSAFSLKMMPADKQTSYFSAQNCLTVGFGQNRPTGEKLQGRTESRLTLAFVDSFL